MRLIVLSKEYSVAKIPSDATLTADLLQALQRGGLGSVTFTRDEVSLVLPDNECENLPARSTIERGWRAFFIPGQLDFSLVGILSSILGPLAAAQISVFAVSTFNTGTFFPPIFIP